MNNRRDRLSDLHRINDALRSAAPMPDLSSSILARVDAERAFVCRRGRALVWAGRGVAVGLIALVALGLALAYRAKPGSLDLQARATPASDVIDTFAHRAARQYVQIREAVEPVRSESEFSVVLSGIAPIRQYTDTLGQAVFAATFVGPPVPDSAQSSTALWYAGDAVSVGGFGGLRVSFAEQAAPKTQTVWPRAELPDAMKSQGWLDEDESGLLMGLNGGAPVAPR